MHACFEREEPIALSTCIALIISISMAEALQTNCCIRATKFVSVLTRLSIMSTNLASMTKAILFASMHSISSNLVVVVLLYSTIFRFLSRHINYTHLRAHETRHDL